MYTIISGIRRLLRLAAWTAAVLAGILVIFKLYGWQAVMNAQARQTADRIASSPLGGEYVTAADTRLFVQRLGKRSAPPVVFIHGTGAWSEAWRASMQTAVAQGYQAIAIDMPPFGYSLPPAGDYSRPRQAARLLAAMDTMGITHATFVAHSFGAATLMEALLARPDLATSVVLVDAALGLDSPATDGRDSTIQALLRKPWISEPLSAVVLTNPAHTATLLHRFITEKDKATPPWIALYRQPLNLSGSYREVARWLPELVAGRGQARSDDPEAYRTLPYPVFLIWGERDTITPLEQALRLGERMPTTRLFPIAGAGHIPQIEEPDRFQEALAEALGHAVAKKH